LTHRDRLQQIVAILVACISELETVGVEIPEQSRRCILGLLWLATDEIELALGESLSVRP
jgi:hypothetical protein